MAARSRPAAAACSRPREVGVHDRAVPGQGEDQGHIDADSLAGDLRDGGETFWGGRDLHEHVVAVHRGPQGAGHVRGGGGVTGQPGVDLDGDPPVLPGCLPVHRGKDVAGGADVIGGDREDGSLRAGPQLGQVTQLAVIPVALGQGRREDRGVGRHADDVPAGDERLELAAGEQLAGEVVQPYRDALGGQLGKRVMAGVTGHVRTFRIRQDGRRCRRPPGKGGGMASSPGAVLGVVDAVSCGGGSDAQLAVRGLVVSEGSNVRRRRCWHPQGLGALLAVCFDEAFDKLVDITRLG